MVDVFLDLRMRHALEALHFGRHHLRCKTTVIALSKPRILGVQFVALLLGLLFQLPAIRPPDDVGAQHRVSDRGCAVDVFHQMPGRRPAVSPKLCTK